MQKEKKLFSENLCTKYPTCTKTEKKKTAFANDKILLDTLIRSHAFLKVCLLMQFVSLEWYILLGPSCSINPLKYRLDIHGRGIMLCSMVVTSWKIWCDFMILFLPPPFHSLQLLNDDGKVKMMLLICNLRSQNRKQFLISFNIIMQV